MKRAHHFRQFSDVEQVFRRERNARERPEGAAGLALLVERLRAGARAVSRHGRERVEGRIAALDRIEGGFGHR